MEMQSNFYPPLAYEYMEDMKDMKDTDIILIKKMRRAQGVE